ncbi:unnamed protein product [Cyclocybe aegerita]|uniref:Uncharacterized protein n=1 Tax=Cyclocybe aegerita TaxID=1973307 RepID=A0A8S0WJC6_CYCAE|nr:unnamed protein product [Cyclocybe aegerita]
MRFQIACWFAHRSGQKNDVKDIKRVSPENPVIILLAPVQKKHKSQINTQCARKMVSHGVMKGRVNIELRRTIARTLFNELLGYKQIKWERMARGARAAASKESTEVLNGELSKNPESMQK